MERISVRELRQHASQYLARVKAGETVEVTERGVLVAELGPPSGETTARERLIRSGRLRPATRSFRLPDRRPHRPGEITPAETLDEQREERLG